MKLEIRLFRFNAKFDYLPHYEPFIYRSVDGETIRDMLKKHAQNNPLFVCDLNIDYGIKINGVAVMLDTLLSDVAQKLGSDLIIEPISTKRAIMDLEIDSRDFDEKFALFGELTTSDDRDFYNSYKTHYYASPVRDHDEGYLGEALFMLANRLILDKPNEKSRILSIISQKESGIFNYVGFAGRVFAQDEKMNETILAIQEEAKVAKISSGETIARLETTIPDQVDSQTVVIKDSGALNLTDSDFGGISIGSIVHFSGYALAKNNPQLASKFALRLIMDTMDSGATKMLCLSSEVAKFLNSELAKLKRRENWSISLEII